MPETPTLTPTDALQPQQPLASIELTHEIGIELAKSATEKGFSMWGHGTPFTDMQSFFNEGIKTGSYSTLLEVGIGITPNDDPTQPSISNPSSMASWSHQRGEGPLNVVLLAVPNPDPENGVIVSMLASGVIDDDSRRIDPELIMGFYDAVTNVITLNPAVDLSPELRDKYLKLSKEKHAAIHDDPLSLLDQGTSDSHLVNGTPPSPPGQTQIW